MGSTGSGGREQAGRESAGASASGTALLQATAHQSKTGAITVEVKITATKELKIYETVPAIIDGGLQAQILDGTDYAGTAYLPFPWNGSEVNTTLKGICRNPVQKAKKYTVKVEPYYLWAMEK